MTKIGQVSRNTTPVDIPGENKQIAKQFLELVAAGKIDEAYEKFVSKKGKHHNPFFREGFPALQDGMKENQVQFPNKQLMIKNIIGEGDMVAIHSFIVPRAGESGIAAVHLFRFLGGKIIELWGIDQPVPADSINRDGVF
jgi:predicted SnoaL-like aldol condensation-catalyzing enzyme